jgi:hypothetical protein
MIDMGVVTPEFFETFGVRPIAGRVLTRDDRDGAAPVVVVSESVARHYWPNGAALGKRLSLDGAGSRSASVVGIVRDMRYRELREARSSIYFPLRQSFFPFVPTVLAIRTVGDPAAMTSTIRAAVTAADPGVAAANVAPFETFLAKPLLLAVFAVAGVVLCAIGLMGVMMTMVRQRARELGIRIALGATIGRLRRMVLGRGLSIAATGLIGGIVGAVRSTVFSSRCSTT